MQYLFLVEMKSAKEGGQQEDLITNCFVFWSSFANCLQFTLTSGQKHAWETEFPEETTFPNAKQFSLWFFSDSLPGGHDDKGHGKTILLYQNSSRYNAPHYHTLMENITVHHSTVYQCILLPILVYSTYHLYFSTHTACTFITILQNGPEYQVHT